jgi:hypothetical protein
MRYSRARFGRICLSLLFATQASLFISTASAQTAATTSRHPLDPLTAEEIQLTAKTLAA